MDKDKCKNVSIYYNGQEFGADTFDQGIKRVCDLINTHTATDALMVVRNVTHYIEEIGLYTDIDMYGIEKISDGLFTITVLH